MNQPVQLSSLQKQSDAPKAHPYEALKRQLEQSKGEFLPLMGGSQENVDAFIRVTLNAVLANPDLLGADRRSLIASCMKAAQDGLMPDGREAVLNIYNVKVKEGNVERWVQAVQYLPMVGGLIKLMYSGEVAYVDAAAVYANDRFVFKRGDSPTLEHEPTMSDDCGPLIAAYAVVKLTNGEVKREVMPMRDIKKVREASKAQGPTSPWAKWPDQMAIKSVLKRINKQLPKPDRFDRAAANDNAALGFAGDAESVSTIAARKSLGEHPSQTIDNGAAATMQLGHEAPVTLDFGSLHSRDPVPVGDRDDSGDTQAHQQAQRTDATPAFDAAAFERKLVGCTSLDALDLMADDIRMLPNGQQRDHLSAVYEKARNAIEAAQARPATGVTPAQAPAPRARTTRMQAPE